MKKKLFTLVACLILALQVFAVNSQNWKSEINKNPDLKELSLLASQMSLDEFLHLTPKKFKEITGERLGLKNSIKLKMIQRSILSKKASAYSINQTLYIIMAILPLGWLAIGLLTDWDGPEWVYCLIGYFIFYIPGVIYALFKMQDFY